MLTKLNHVLLAGVVALACSSCQTEKKTAEERIQKNNDTVKEQKTQKKGERRQAVRKTRSKPQPNKPVKGRRTLY